jgi:hypothetical protein
MDKKDYGKMILDKNYPDVSWLFFFPGNFDLKKTTAEQWLHTVSQNCNEKNCLSPFEYITQDELRFIKKLPALAKNMQTIQEYMLASSFRNIMIDREEIITEVIAGKEFENCNKKPYDIGYNISPKKFTAIEDEIIENLIRKEYSQEIFSVTTHNTRTGTPPCPHCGGKGFFKCENCKGSGREQYVDGYYANGEERIKTGQCSHCYGTGKIECTECNGTGKQQIYSDKYQIIKRFTNKKNALMFECVSCTWGDSWYNGYDSSYFADDSSYAVINRLQADFWRKFDETDMEQFINKLHKSEREIIIDNNGQQAQDLLATIGQKNSGLYEKNKRAAYSDWKNRDLLKGQLGCSLECHAIVPVVQICCANKINEDDTTIFIYEIIRGGKQGVVCMISGISELKFWRSLFI